MYTLLSGLWNQWTASNQYNVLILGRDKSGKTMLYHSIKQFTSTNVGTPFNLYNDTQQPPDMQITNPFESGFSSSSSSSTSSAQNIVKSALVTTRTYTPTIGLNASKATVQEGVQFQLWDVGGEARLRQLWQHYYLEAHAIIFVHDVNCTEEEFIDARKLLYILMTSPALTGVPIALVFNKFPTGISQAHPTYRELAMKLGLLHILNHFQPQLFPHNSSTATTAHHPPSQYDTNDDITHTVGNIDQNNDFDGLLHFSSLLEDVDTTVDPLTLPSTSTFTSSHSQTPFSQPQPLVIPFGTTAQSNSSLSSPHILSLQENTHLVRVFTLNSMNHLQPGTIQPQPLIDLVAWLIDIIPQTQRAGLLLTG